MDRIDPALLLLRTVFGLFLAYHGLNKVKSGIAGTAGWFASIGMKWPRLQAFTAATTEMVAGVMFAAGFATPVAAAAIIATMTVAIVTVHWRVGFFIFLPNGGWEYCASIIAVAAAVSIGGAGDMTLDNLLGVAWDPAVGLGAVGMGFVLAVAHLTLSHRPGGS
jgi:putative oxidoreductase